MRRGLTLLETVLAATIFSVCLGCLMAFLPTGLRSIKQSEREIFAGNLAQIVLEEYRNWPLSELQEYQTEQVVYSATSDGNRYDVLLSAHPESFATDFAVHLQVEVRWRDRQQGRSLRRELSDCRVAR